MSARLVHSVIAAGLADPELLSLWRQNPNLLRDYGVSPDKMDLTTLWLFAGLSAKVRHNGLRGQLPNTFRFLNISGIEIEMFASYASYQASQGKNFADTLDDRTQDILVFLEQWIDQNRKDHEILWDIVRHERACALLGKNSQATPPGREGVLYAETDPVLGDVPKVNGKIILYEMRSDPQAVIKQLSESHPQIQKIEMGEYLFCYWHKNEQPEIQILSLDELGYYLLLLVDGKCSVEVLSKKLLGDDQPPSSLLKALGEFANMGVISLN